MGFSRRLRKTYRATSQLICLSIIGLIIYGIAVTHHGHYVREYCPRPVVLVGVEEHAKSFEFVRKPKHWPWRGTLFGQPQREPVTEQIALATNLEFHFNLEE